jgi:hypothetical protein
MFDVAIVDVHVDHGVDGIALSRTLHARCPDVALVVMSADRRGAEEAGPIQPLLDVIARAGLPEH